ncbi:hypothetical protein P3T76_011914 [Phytophthora citrophthora]|uniref:TIR domain-containing protein n=1 Tax=Phytophthora citrophthora TaxID=4793 RepID=A0AAD9G8E8_9STRA|nr:hypothetical protein P3T76_011914 [Phytophthora citrophthora]
MGSAASTSSDGDGKPSAVVVCHSTQETTVRDLLLTAFGESSLDVEVLTDSYPKDRQQRAELVAQAQAAFIGIESTLQSSSELIETLSYLKDQRKTVISGPLTFYSRPSGAIGAVCLALGQWDPLLFVESERLAYWAMKYELLTRSELKDTKESTELEPIDVNIPASPQIFFVYCNDTESDRVVNKFVHNSGGISLAGEVIRCLHNLENDLVSLRAASVVCFVITEACTEDDEAAIHFRQLFERALEWRKPLLPIKEQRASLHGWLALAMAGRLWYQVDATNLELVHTPYANIRDCPCKVKDSCLITDFTFCANGLLSSPSRTLERSQIATREQATIRIAKEQAQVPGLTREDVESLCHRVQELINCDNKGLTELGVATTQEAIEIEATEHIDQPKPEDLLPPEQTEDSKKLKPLANIHYEVTRLGFVPPPAVLDVDGLPIVGLLLDAMFSYQWGSQQTVLNIYQQGQIHNLRAWFDVYGHMQGNVNSAMAAAVESVACMVVFLTKAYLGSVNCRLEFIYAVCCRKPMIFAFLEDPETLELPEWVISVVGTTQFNVYPSLIRASPDSSRVLALDMRAERVRGVPMTDILFGAVRRLAAWRSTSPISIVYDGSLLLYATTSALHHALVKEKGGSKSTLCTRCGGVFSPEIPASLEGCHRHTAYYVGGSIIAGRWVCCQETDKDGPGCHPAQHMTTERTWTVDPSYGTYTYEPNSL